MKDSRCREARRAEGGGRHLRRPARLRPGTRPAHRCTHTRFQATTQHGVDAGAQRSWPTWWLLSSWYRSSGPLFIFLLGVMMWMPLRIHSRYCSLGSSAPGSTARAAGAQVRTGNSAQTWSERDQRGSTCGGFACGDHVPARRLDAQRRCTLGVRGQGGRGPCVPSSDHGWAQQSSTASLRSPEAVQSMMTLLGT